MLKALPIVLLLAGCAGETAVFDARACPKEQAYSKAQQTKMADDLANTPASIRRAMTDYGKLRDKVRACRRAG